MTAYGAVISLNNTIRYIYHSSHITLVDPSKTIIKTPYNELQPLQEILERLDKTSKSRSRKKVNALDGRIRDKIWEFEDKLESLITDQILSQSQSPPSHRVSILGWLRKKVKNGSQASQSRSKRDEFLFSIDLHSLQDDVASFIQALKDMEMEYIYELENMAEDDDDVSGNQSTIGFGATKPKMIGLSDLFENVRRTVLGGYERKFLYALVGMAGVGKTTLAREIYEDPEILSHFECRAWVSVGRKSQFNEVAVDVLTQLCGVTLGEGDEEVEDTFKRRLDGKKCLIVLDDVWETELVNSFVRPLPVDRSIKILVTTRETKVIADVTYRLTLGRFKVVRFLNEEESKELLCEKVFGGKELCPVELDKAATKIAKKCEGLPLMILAVADILAKSQNREPEYWNDVAEERNSVFTDAYNEISKVLYPSYDYLPQYLKMPFLYMGVFPRDCDIPQSKIINMLTVEGWFRGAKKSQASEGSASECLDELCSNRNIVLFKEKSLSWSRRHGRGLVACSKHVASILCGGTCAEEKLGRICFIMS